MRQERGKKVAGAHIVQGSLQDPWEREAGYHVRVETKAMTAAENKNKPNTDCSTRLSNAPQAEQQLIP